MKRHICRNKGRISILALALLAAAALLVWLAPEGMTQPREVGARARPLLPSPDGAYLAFTYKEVLDGDPRPVCVVDREGNVVLVTGSDQAGVFRHYPRGWLPDGRTLLLTEMLWPGERQTNDEPEVRSFFLSVPDGERRDVKTQEPGNVLAQFVLDEASFVARPDDPRGEATASLYLVRKMNDTWEQRRLLAPDEPERRWYSVLWARREDGELTAIARRRERSISPPALLSSFWLVLAVPGDEARVSKLGDVEAVIYGADVTDDGRKVAAVKRSRRRPNHVILIDVTADAVTTFRDAPINASFLAFSPDDSELLLWRTGWREPRLRDPQLALLDLETGEARRVELPGAIASLLDIAWLTRDTVLVSGGRALFRWNLRDDRYEKLLDLPETLDDLYQMALH